MQALIVRENSLMLSIMSESLSKFHFQTRRLVILSEIFPDFFFYFSQACIKIVSHIRPPLLTALSSRIEWPGTYLTTVRDRIPVGTRFFVPVQTGPVAHPASCTMGTGSFPWGKVRPGRAADHSPPSSAAVMEE